MLRREKKVLLVAINFPPARGGSAAVYGSLARHARERIVVLAPRLNYQDGLPIIGWREQDRRAGFRVFRPARLRTQLHEALKGRTAGRIAFLASDLALRLGLLLRILHLLCTEPIGAVCIGEIVPNGWLIAALRHLLPVRVAAYVHGEEVTTDDPYDPGHRRAARALRAADSIIVVSEFSREAVCGLIGAQHAGKVCLIENGVDTSQFFPAERRADLVEQYGLGGCFVYVAVCRLLEKKGLDMTIRAFARVIARHPRARLLIVGSGPYEGTLRSIAASLGLGDSVVFAGDVAAHDVAAHYRLGDVFVMPNRALANGDTEGFGLVFLEANACGLPVIGGRDGGTGAAVRHGENGLLVDGNRLDEITAAMTLLHEDAEQRQRIATAGRAAAARAGWQAKAQSFISACLGPRSPGRTTSIAATSSP